MTLDEAVERCDALIEWYWEGMEGDEQIALQQKQDVEMLEFFLKLGKMLKYFSKLPLGSKRGVCARYIVRKMEVS